MRPRPVPTPLDAAALDRLALRYVERYATSRAKLAAYLSRKLRERGWVGSGEPAVAALADRFAQMGYVDDATFAATRGAALGRRGYGARRVGQALHAAGIEPPDAEPVLEGARDAAWDTALAFARRKRIGPFAAAPHDERGRARALGALLRAGHSFAIARRLVDAAPGVVPDDPG